MVLKQRILLRDGLKENEAYERLKTITLEVISKLEERRFVFRRKLGLTQTALKIESELETLFEFDKLINDVKTVLSNVGVSEDTTENIVNLIDQFNSIFKLVLLNRVLILSLTAQFFSMLLKATIKSVKNKQSVRESLKLTYNNFEVCHVSLLFNR